MTIEEQILDADGSCRDVNFPDVEREDALSLLRFVVGLGSVDSAYDDSGEPIDELQIEERLTESRSNTLVTNWILSGLVSHIQLFFFWESDSKVFVELTFDPRAIDRSMFSFTAFKAWVQGFAEAIGTKTFFVRYESVSWEYGDTSESSGVIFSNDYSSSSTG